MIHRLNIWYFSSLLISIVVAVPIIIIFSSFFELTSEYSLILKETFLLDYIVNSFVLLIGVIIITSIIGIGCAYLISFYDFPGAKFFKWGLILSFAVPAYIYSYSLTAFLKIMELYILS
jgi:iron(III) transport system permease protein